MLPVYCEHFGLTREPFNVTPDPSFLYLSASHKEALAQLIYGIKARRGFVVLTGEVGTGKTTLIHCLLEQIDDGHTHSAFLYDVTGSPKDLLRSLSEGFGLTAPTEIQHDVPDYLNSLNRFLLESYQKGDNVALIIDEAQTLSAEVLERVRLLSNFETKQDKLVQILLVGQPELSDRLNQPELRQLKQRVALRHHLSALNLSECQEYIAKRLEISGGAASLFPVAVVEEIHTYSGGIPRLVNILCDNGLLSAYALRKDCVEPAMITEIAQDLQLTVSRRRAVAGRESVAITPKETCSRQIRVRLSDVMDTANGKRPRRINIQPSRAKPTSESKPIADDDLKRADKVIDVPADKAIDPPAEKLIDVPMEPANGAGRPLEAVLELAPPRFFETMVAVLTEAMGPMAFLVVRDHVAAMGESRDAFPKRRLGQLIDETSAEILSESMKDRFQELMSKEIHTINAGEDWK